ncbi:MAG: hypothetical protein KH452_12850 [Clostridiales bacterium]|nr:hypothetical protein [Clostridiales bacterium]
MKKRETLSRGEELLAQVLEECLEEDLSFVPPEREIARSHHFSERFEQSMRKIMEDTTKNFKEQDIQKHFSPRYGQWAACVLVFCLCSGLFYYVIGPFADKEAPMESAATTEEAADESAVTETPAMGTDTEILAESAPEEDALEEDTPEEGSLEAAAEEKEAVKEKTYCGQTVYLAEQQEVPETLDYVTTLVNCPVLDEANPVLYLTIGNIGEEEVQYLDRYDLEVWIDDGWYQIPSEGNGESEWIPLEKGMAVDEEIDLSGYQIDYGAQQYRLITYVNEDLISAEFTFEEVFTETMEKLEDEASRE